MTYEAATHVRIETQEPIWRALVFAGDQYLGGVDTVVAGAVSNEDARRMVHETLALQHLNAGLVDQWEPAQDGAFVIPVTYF